MCMTVTCYRCACFVYAPVHQSTLLAKPLGAGFGEYAILATTNKIRSCACVAIDENSMMLIMHADTYNAVLRQHHYRQKQLSSATALLQELPLFRHHTYPKVASIAYTMRSQTYSNQTTIVNFGDTINNVLLIASGQVKVFAPPMQQSSQQDPQQQQRETPLMQKILQKRIPRLAIALLGRGQIIGEMEIQNGIRTFQMSYVSGSASTEILEMPASVFKESIVAGSFTQSMLYKTLGDLNKQKEARRMGQMERAYGAMREMMGGGVNDIKAHDDMSNILPVIMDPPPTQSPTQPQPQAYAQRNSPSRRASAAITGTGTSGWQQQQSPRRGASFSGGGGAFGQINYGANSIALINIILPSVPLVVVVVVAAAAAPRPLHACPMVATSVRF